MYLNILYSSFETVKMVFFYDYVPNIACVFSINFLNSIVKIVANLLFKSIHQLDAICYLYMPCRHLNKTMFSDTQANYTVLVESDNILFFLFKEI